MSLRWLAAGAAGLWAYARYAEAKKVGVSLDRAFKFANLGKSIATLHGEDFDQRDALALRAWKASFPDRPYPGLLPALNVLTTKH